MTSAIRVNDFAAVAGGSPQMVLHVGGRTAVPAGPSVVEEKIQWSLLVRARRNRLASGIRPSSVEVLAWNAVQAMRRQSIPCESVGVGVAVVTELSSFPAFCEAVRRQAQAVREGFQENRVPQLLVSCKGLDSCTPHPLSIASLQVEAPGKTGESRVTLTFHRSLLDSEQAVRLLEDTQAGIAAHDCR